MLLELTNSKHEPIYINSLHIEYMEEGRKYTFVHMMNGNVHYVLETMAEIKEIFE